MRKRVIFVFYHKKKKKKAETITGIPCDNPSCNFDLSHSNFENIKKYYNKKKITNKILPYS